MDILCLYSSNSELLFSITIHLLGIVHSWKQRSRGYSTREMRAIFLAHLERHPTVHIYTDDSKSTKGVGFAAVFPNTTSGGRLTGEASIFTAELYVINAAVNEILKGPTDGNRFTIFCDSRSALLAPRSLSLFLQLWSKPKNYRIFWRIRRPPKFEDKILI